MPEKENKIWRIIKDLFNLLINKIPGVKAYREILRNRKVDKNFEDINKKIDNSKRDEKETILLRQILNKKIFDTRKLLETIKGDYFLLIIFAFPRLSGMRFNPDQEIIENFLSKRLKKKDKSNQRFYSSFLTEKLKFNKLGYRSSTNFFIKVKDLPKDLRKISFLREYLEKNLLIQQKEEWNLVLKLLSKSKNRKIIQYVKEIENKGFDELYNISFYLDFINFKKDNIFVQNENSFFISHFLKLEDIIEDKKSLESLRENFKFFDISLFFTTSIPQDIRGILDEEQDSIRSSLNIEHFFQEINKDDLNKIFKNVLNRRYEEKYVNSFYNNQKKFRDLLIQKGIII